MTTPRDRQFTPDTEGHSVRCSFCNKGPETVGELIEGPAGPDGAPAYICAECVELCASILEHRRMLEDAEQDPDRDEINAANRKLLEHKVDEELSILTSLERDVIKLRYGLSDYTYTLNEVADKFGITPERVREIESKAVEILGSRKPQT